MLWSSRILKIVADSTAHAETAEGSRCAKSDVYIRTVLEGIGRAVKGPTVVIGDSSAMNDLVNKDGTSSRSRHFERATIFIKYAIQRLIVTCLLVGTRFMVADVFTKATDEATFKRMRAVLRNDGSDTYGMRVREAMSAVMRLVGRRGAR